MPKYTILKQRRPAGVWDPDSEIGPRILTRVMWLDGIDKENINTLGRYIFIHGTPYENRIGRPNSGGCINMKNDDIMELFDLIDKDTTIVEIYDGYVDSKTSIS